jgi:1-deoxy-D-xylulose-5-phosphate reductoisomerase
VKSLAILGSTGSVGRTTLRVVSESGGRYTVDCLAADVSWEMISEQAEEFRPARLALSNADAAGELKKGLAPNVGLLSGPGALEEIVRASEADLVVNAVSGAVGLAPTLATLDTGRDVALANKESIAMAGPLVMQRASEAGNTVIPVDSEHSAIFQAMRGEKRDHVRRIMLTASGGPFRTASKRHMAKVTPREALEHPTWGMGTKITIDSATMMNKALEIVEARWLFGLEVSRIDVVVHPQSIVHSLVEYCDGSTIAQMGYPDMAVPVRFALAYPEREKATAKPLDLPDIGSLSFHRPDFDRFPALRLGYRAGEEGGTMGAVMNAANEVAVGAFLEGRIGFLNITEIVERVMDLHRVARPSGVEEIMEADSWARAEAEKWAKS